MQIIFPKAQAWCVVLLGSLLSQQLCKDYLPGQVYEANGGSMEPTLPSHTLIVASPVHFYSHIDRGNLVILKDRQSREEPQSLVVKRVIGLPGETVSIFAGNVYINDRLMVEGYCYNQPTFLFQNQQAVYSLGPDEFFVLGDNRRCSADSRLYGPVIRKQILAINSEYVEVRLGEKMFSTEEKLQVYNQQMKRIKAIEAKTMKPWVSHSSKRDANAAFSKEPVQWALTSEAKS
jgi:signal peptidase I